ncbi:MAG: 50S ribosomal protein L25, partial [Bacteroidota bacterium]|nr:50S ribosomal protein L25 [Bacteroidota bacterium]
MPEHIQVDISKLLLGESLHVRDLKFDNINFLTAPESVVVAVVAPRAEKEATEAPAEPEVIAKGKTEKGEE